jgi:hypothetical protein
MSPALRRIQAFPNPAQEPTNLTRADSVALWRAVDIFGYAVRAMKALRKVQAQVRAMKAAKAVNP